MEKAIKSSGFVHHSTDVEGQLMDGGASIRWLITHRDGAENYSMRLITVEKGKSTPHHHHDYEHEIYIISGKVRVTLGDSMYVAKADDFIFIPPNVEHGMDAEEDTRMICVVPIKAAKMILGE
ncbi:cupin domain-containing protein [Thermoplasma sp. Kam2015]|uniref:cupin domain-containing protein n=1 Tax=Thermoplasma sp. Kam2015 TaxID=2094122 RepID=UPI000D9CE4AE|nr:cupin domain-containing protein [Thermoplasma sp. Kam2015]PYB69110.1 cupin domain-containing protein [Thermoplasma sp. Kam2015]